MNIIVYLLQVSACVGIFFALYYFILNRLTFFTINRWYLIATLAFSFIIPLLNITVGNEYVPAVQGVNYVNQLQEIPGKVLIAENAVEKSKTNLSGILKSTYLMIAIGLFIRLLVVIASFFLKIKLQHSTKVGHVHIIHGNNIFANGSFLHFIFLNDYKLSQDEKQQIIQHEMLHVIQLHSVDRIILEIAKIVLWFNPFIYLYSRAVEENHEFEVDREMGLLADRKKYADLLLHLSVANQGTFYHSFSKTPLEKRITMLFNQPTKSMKKIIYVLVLPIGAISCLAFANLKIEKKSSALGQLNSQSINNVTSHPKLTPTRSYDFGLKFPATLDSQSVSSQFYSRQEIHKANGEITIKAKFTLVDGSASADFGPLDKLGIFIDGTFYDEEAIKKLPAEKTALLTFDRSKDAFKREKIPSGNYAVPFCFKTKDK